MRTSKKDITCIAVDMGAGSIRVMLGTLGKDYIRMEEVHRIDNEILVEEGRDTWDMERIIREIMIGISSAIESAKDSPVSIGVESWGVDFVLLDRNGDLVDTPVAYRDSRTQGMQEQWRKLMPDRETFERTGINFYIFNTLFQLLSLKGSKALQRTSKILFIPAYISYLLTGKMLNEETIASTSQLLSAEGRTWDSKILEKLDLDKKILGEVIPSGTLLGPLTLPTLEKNRMECIAVSGHDTACVVAALPVENSNYAFISAGTWCIVGMETNRPLISEEALKVGITNERAYGGGYRSLKNIVGLWLLQGLKKDMSTGISFEQMEAMVKGEGESIHLINPDDPCFYNPARMKDAFDSFFEKSGQSKPGRFSDYIRCAYDSLCFSFRSHIELLEKLSQEPVEVLHLVGGGSQSDYLCQRVASICKREVISGPVEGAAMGNALIQGIAMGKIRDLQEGRDLVKKSCKVKRYRAETSIPGLEERYKTYLKLKT
jgi:rhamnulokinase